MADDISLRCKWDDGRRFKEVEKIGCTGCAADLDIVDTDDIMMCFKLPECRAKFRKDGRNVVYVLIEDAQ